MKLADLIDLEWLLREDAALPAGALDAARDAAARTCAPGVTRQQVDHSRELRAALALAFLAAVRARSDDLPGQRLSRALEFAALLLVVLGALAGAGTTQALLAYDGRQPVNVLPFAAVLFGLQIVLLLALLLLLLRGRRGRAGEGMALLHRPLGWLVDRLLGARGRAAAAALHALRARRALYAGIERWTLLGLAQRFGVAFNLGALAVALATIAFSDLVFAWSTTLDLGARDVHAAVAVLAWPWQLWAAAVPSLEVVEASRWVRMPGAFASGRTLAEALPLAAQWWRFLVAGILVYGLLPRVLALALAAWRRRRALHAVALDHAGYQRLLDRLLPAATAWLGPDPRAVRGKAPEAAAAPLHGAPAAKGTRATAVCFGSIAAAAPAVRETLTRRFDAGVGAMLAAGGAALEDDRRALQELARARPERAFVVFAAGQQPTADALGFVRQVRAALGAGRPLLVLLLELDASGALGDAEPIEVEIWRRALGALEDPHLWVETLEVRR